MVSCVFRCCIIIHILRGHIHYTQAHLPVRLYPLYLLQFLQAHLIYAIYTNHVSQTSKSGRAVVALYPVVQGEPAGRGRVVYTVFCSAVFPITF